MAETVTVTADAVGRRSGVGTRTAALSAASMWLRPGWTTVRLKLATAPPTSQVGEDDDTGSGGQRKVTDESPLPDMAVTFLLVVGRLTHDADCPGMSDRVRRVASTIWIVAARERQDEAGARRRVGDRDRSAVGLRDFSHDRQSESRSTVISGTGVVEADESVEDS